MSSEYSPFSSPRDPGGITARDINRELDIATRGFDNAFRILDDAEKSLATAIQNLGPSPELEIALARAQALRGRVMGIDLVLPINE